MTWIICSSCNRATFAYGNDCEHCGKSLKDGDEFTPLYGLGGEPLPRYFCHRCGFVNEAEATRIGRKPRLQKSLTEPQIT
jgi:hypothetical protein